MPVSASSAVLTELPRRSTSLPVRLWGSSPLGSCLRLHLRNCCGPACLCNIFQGRPQTAESSADEQHDGRLVCMSSGTCHTSGRVLQAAQIAHPHQTGALMVERDFSRVIHMRQRCEVQGVGDALGQAGGLHACMHAAQFLFACSWVPILCSQWLPLLCKALPHPPLSTPALETGCPCGITQVPHNRNKAAHMPTQHVGTCMTLTISPITNTQHHCWAQAQCKALVPRTAAVSTLQLVTGSRACPQQ